jgi:Domain of unknown function (DUF4192)
MTASKKSGRRRRHPEPRSGLKVGRPDDLLAIIPYLVGFHPDESIVAVFIKSGRIVLTARMDLPPESASGELAEQIEYIAKRHGTHALAIVAYSAASLPTHRLLTRLMDRLGKQKLTDVLHVGHGRWWSLTCAEDCCPLSGTPFDLSSHPVSAAAVFVGLGTLASRQELAASIGGPPEAELPRLQALVNSLLADFEDFEDHIAAARLTGRLVDLATSDPGVLDERTCLLLGLLVTDMHIRDLAWALISPTNAEGACQALGWRRRPRTADVGRCTAVPTGHGGLGRRIWRPPELLLRAAGARRSELLHGEIALRDQRTSASAISLADAERDAGWTPR